MGIFLDKAARPDEGGALAAALGRSFAVWTGLKKDLCAEWDDLSEEWTYAGKSSGWSLRLKRGKRAILYLVPQDKSFLAAFALGEKACAAAASAGLPDSVLEAIRCAPKYVEGRAVRLPIRSKADLAGLMELARIKNSGS